MENKVGDNVPSQKKLDEHEELVRTAVKSIQPFCITLQKEDRASTVKPHKGAEAMVEKAYALAKRYGVTVQNVPLEGMMNDLRLSRQMDPFAALFALGAQLTADTTLQAKSEFWTAFLAYYGALSTAADHDPALAAELRPLIEEMRAVRRPRGSTSAKDDGEGEAPKPA